MEVVVVGIITLVLVAIISFTVVISGYINNKISKALMFAFFAVGVLATVMALVFSRDPADPARPTPTPSIEITIPASQTPAAATQTPAPATEPPIAPTNTSVPPTNTSVLPTKTSEPPTETAVPPTPLSVPNVVTRVAEEDGMIQVYVPEGNFLMGSLNGDGDAKNDEMPQRSVYLDAFWIDQVEATNSRYALCVASGQCPPRAEDTQGSYTRDEYYDNPEYSNYSVIKVSWDEARTYCQWAGRRLPTEAEWEKAARGTDGRKYPWGNEPPTADRLNFNNNEGDTTEVASYFAGASPYGALDMAGNVWEWVADWYDEAYYSQSIERNPTGPESGVERVARGGSWFDNTALLVRVANRGKQDPTAAHFYFNGFRCAASGSADE